MENAPKEIPAKLLQGIGYIKARRAEDQSSQEMKITQALIREILCSADEKMMVMF